MPALFTHKRKMNNLYFSFFLINNSSLITYQKKKKDLFLLINKDIFP